MYDSNSRQNQKQKSNSMRIATKTQYVQKGSHLFIELKSIFPAVLHPHVQPQKPPSDDTPMQTNFNITISNPYAFILLHLRNKSNKNIVNINIPQICVFHDRVPYDLIYSSKGYIRGTKPNENAKLKMRQVNKIFKQSWVLNGAPKNQPSMAVFLQNQVLMLSDSDLYLVTCKSKVDSFFKKLIYLRNKIPSNDNKPIIVNYSEDKQQDEIMKFATQSLQGYYNDSTIYNIFYNQFQQDQKQLAQIKYLSFLNEKIAMYLNYEHNIRIKYCDFVYIKANNGTYYFTNATNFQFSNLTSAILQREKRLAQRQQQRNRILIMTPQKEKRYKSYQHRQHIKTYQNLMGDQFQTMVRKMNFLTMTDNKKEEVKNQMAFRRLHPKSKFNYFQMVNSTNFIKIKNQILESNKRKPLTVPSKYVLRYYNRVRNPKVHTQVISLDQDL